MREIKFRAWVDRANRMYQVISIGFKSGIVEIEYNGDIGFEKRACIELMQFTSLHDKNGKEIYEGDIIRGVFSSHPQNWTVGELSAYGLTFNRLTIKPSPSPYHYRDMRHKDQWEVIGNIWENPELVA